MKISSRTLNNAVVFDENRVAVFTGDLEIFECEQNGEKFTILQSNNPRLLGAGVISENLMNRKCPVNHNELSMTKPCPECGQ